MGSGPLTTNGPLLEIYYLRLCLMSKNKNVLFIGLSYHDYTASIANEMRMYGCLVKYIDIQPRTLLFKIFRTLASQLYKRYLDLHHRRSIKALEHIEFDVVLFLQAHQFSLANLDLLKSLQTKAEFILYNWDALSTHDYRPQAPYFSRVYTFDKLDAETYGFCYLPLFFTRSLQQLCRGKTKRRNVYMIGNIVNVARYKAVEHFKRYCLENGINFQTYLVSSPVVYLLMLWNGIIPRQIHFKPIHQAELITLVESSAAVFDFANHAQSGYTMRTIENLCAGKKIITNNNYVKGDYFYSEDRIFVFKECAFNGVVEFLDNEILDKNEKFEELGIQSFVKTILGPLADR